MKFVIYLSLYALIGACALAWSCAGMTHFIITFLLFFAYAFLGGVFFNTFTKRGVFI